MPSDMLIHRVQYKMQHHFLRHCDNSDNLCLLFLRYAAIALLVCAGIAFHSGNVALGLMNRAGSVRFAIVNSSIGLLLTSPQVTPVLFVV